MVVYMYSADSYYTIYSEQVYFYSFLLKMREV